MDESYATALNTELNTSNKQLIELMSAVFTKGCNFRFQASGTSMSPFIKDGDVLTLSPIDQKSIFFGDVLALIRPANNKLIIHRVVGINNCEYLIKADNQKEPDGWVSFKHLYGKVSKIERNNNEIRIGLGWERYPIAQLSRANCLKFSVRILWVLMHPFLGRHSL